MVRSLPKDRLLPSLLDRLTDDDPVNRDLKTYRQKIEVLEDDLAALKKPENLGKPKELRRKRDNLLLELEQARAQYSVLLGSISSLNDIRECVKRDLDGLLNARNYIPQEELDEYPEIKTSVLNYGLPDFTGKTLSGTNVQALEKRLKQSILNFEPRIIRKTLRVRLLANELMSDHNALNFEIEGELYAEPVPIHLHLRTQLELESGDMLVQEFYH
jgi:type VI secretion system lysozyme-like protein